MAGKYTSSHREIERRIRVDRKTIRRHAANSGVARPTGSAGSVGQIPPPRPPATVTPSACEAHRAFIEAQVQLGRYAQSIHQDFGRTHGPAASQRRRCVSSSLAKPLSKVPKGR